MTYEERNNVVAILTNLGVTGYFGSRIWSMYQAGVFEGPDGLAAWAQTVLWIVPASIVATIVLTIIVTILVAIVTQNPDPETQTDERDRQNGLRAMQVAMVIVSIGFIGSMIGLALGWPALVALNMILAGFALGSLGGNVTSIYLSRRGY